MTRRVCGDCGGDGKSRDPEWKSCFACCGFGTYPLCYADVEPRDIGNTVSVSIEYDAADTKRVAVYVSGNTGRLGIIAHLGGSEMESARGVDVRPVVDAIVAVWFLRARSPLGRGEVNKIWADRSAGVGALR